MIVAKWCNKILLVLGQKGEYKSYLLIQKDENKITEF